MPYKPANFCWDGRSVSVYTRIPIFVCFAGRLVNTPRVVCRHGDWRVYTPSFLRVPGVTVEFLFLGYHIVYMGKLTWYMYIIQVFFVDEKETSTSKAESERVTSGLRYHRAGQISWYSTASMVRQSGANFIKLLSRNKLLTLVPPQCSIQNVCNLAGSRFLLRLAKIFAKQSSMLSGSMKLAKECHRFQSYLSKLLQFVMVSLGN